MTRDPYGEWLDANSPLRDDEYTLDQLERYLSRTASDLIRPDIQRKYSRHICDKVASAMVECLRKRPASDREADLVRLGYVIGKGMGVLVEQARIIYGRPSKTAAEVFLRDLASQARKERSRRCVGVNNRMAETYRELEPEVGCLAARREIRNRVLRPDGKKYSMAHIRNIIRNGRGNG